MDTDSSWSLILLDRLQVALLDHLSLFAVCGLDNSLDIRARRLDARRSNGVLRIPMRVRRPYAYILEHNFADLPGSHLGRCLKLLFVVH